MDFYDDEAYGGYSFEDTIPDYERFEQNQLALDNEGYDGDEEEEEVFALEPEEDRTFFLDDERDDLF